MASVSIWISNFCLTFTLFKGFVQRYFTSNDNIHNDSNVVPYPFTIYPSPYPRNEYEKAYRIQYGINKLIQRLAFDIDLMDSVFQKLTFFSSSK
jgi:hypothetical protein